MLDFCTEAAQAAPSTTSAPVAPHDTPIEAGESPLLVNSMWDIDDDLGALLFGVAPAPDLRRRSCRNVVIGGLASAVWAGHTGVFYSRDRNWYARNRGLLPAYISLRSIRWSIATLETGPMYFQSCVAKPTRPGAGDTA